MLLAIEASPHGYAPKLEIEGYTQEEIGYHALLLGESGLAKVYEKRIEEAQTPEAIVERLTWAGHEFLDASREPRIWNQAKDAINKIGSASISVWLALLAELAKKKVGL